MYLRRPRLAKYEPGDSIRRIVALYLTSLVGGKQSVLQKELPRYIAAWGKIRIGHGGDKIRAVLGETERMGVPERKSSYIRVSPTLSATVFGRID